MRTEIVAAHFGALPADLSRDSTIGVTAEFSGPADGDEGGHGHSNSPTFGALSRIEMPSRICSRKAHVCSKYRAAQQGISLVLGM